MRRRPIPMEAAAHVIAHTAERHRAQRRGHLRPGLRGPCRARTHAAEISSSTGRGNLGASPNPPFRRSNAERYSPRPASTSRGRRAGFRARSAVCAGDALSRSNSSAAAKSIRARSSDQTRQISWRMSTNPGRPQREFRRKIRSAEERLQLRRQKHRHRPSAGPRRRLHERHVHAIDVRPLLAIDLISTNDAFSSWRPRRSRTTRAPSRGTSDTWNSRWTEISACSRREPSRTPLAPWVPVDGITCVLQQVRAPLASKPIHLVMLT